MSEMSMKEVRAELKEAGIEIPDCAGKILGLAARAYEARNKAQAACAAWRGLAELIMANAQTYVSEQDGSPNSFPGQVIGLLDGSPNSFPGQVIGLLDDMLTLADPGKPILDKLAILEELAAHMRNDSCQDQTRKELYRKLDATKENPPDVSGPGAINQLSTSLRDDYEREHEIGGPVVKAEREKR